METTGYFRATPGLRQGDPLSPALFTVTKVFSRSFRHILFAGTSQPFRIRRGCPTPSHLLYADNTLLFLNGSRMPLLAVNDFLSSFQAASGQRINRSKSCFICSDNLSTGRVKAIERLLDRVEKKVSGWKVRFLSQAGRTVLICHVLGSLPLHVMAVSVIPKQGWVDGRRKFPWIAWNSITRPPEGGLGVRKLQEVLDAMRMKMAWAVKFGDSNGL
ncbi:uncharacterized protein LOC131255108 [Magnolia sinica]|uniref:uncharacterized protein LOC131255108 n=1 Tax=Magnolia sinica TaxID=86752 RepID=UPI0026588C4F|nr:uncharacterized protein LOC131255108 [Magnolia sinica]